MKRDKFLNSIANTIKDYRHGEIAEPTPDHVDRWVSQFDKNVQLPILDEMDYVLKKTYYSVGRVTSFLRGLIETEDLVEKDASAFWRSANFLSIQGGGNSQIDMLKLFSTLLRKAYGIGIEQCGKGDSDFVYLDDAIFTGNRVRRDLEKWIQEQAPERAKLHIVSIALHSGGHYYAHDYITKAVDASGKLIEVDWWTGIELEDRKAYSDVADVLRPTSIPDDPDVETYVKSMKYSPTLRRPGSVGKNALFGSEERRSILEQEFLKAGARIRRICPNLGDTQRPLGHMTLDTLGFGSLFVTYRNCPNNAPLALWVGTSWYPLFPRTTNKQTEMKRLLDELTKGDG